MATSQETSQETFNTSQEMNNTNQEINKTSQETNKKTCNTSQEMNQDEISETELNNTDKIRNAIADNPSVTRYILQQMRAAGKLDRIGSTKNGKWMMAIGAAY